MPEICGALGGVLGSGSAVPMTGGEVHATTPDKSPRGAPGRGDTWRSIPIAPGPAGETRGARAAVGVIFWFPRGKKRSKAGLGGSKKSDWALTCGGPIKLSRCLLILVWFLAKPNWPFCQLITFKSLFHSPGSFTSLWIPPPSSSSSSSVR